MEVLLLGIYALIVWLVFFKFKWLPWTTPIAVGIILFPILALTATILLLNVYAPSTHDVRVIKYVVQIVPRVTGRVVEVPVEPNRLVRKGDVLFRVDPRPFEYEVQRLQALVSTTRASVRAEGEDVRAAEAQIEVSTNRVSSIKSSIEAGRARLKLGELRLTQSKELAESGAGDQFDAQRWETDVAQNRADVAALLTQLQGAESEVTSSQAKAAGLRQKLGAQSGGDQADVAQILAQLRDAEWQLSETTVYAPADGYVINLQLRPGSTVSRLPMNPVMSFVEQTGLIIGLFHQNELRAVEPNNEAEITLETYPGRIIKTKVDSIIWAQGQGQLPVTGTLPQTGDVPPPEGRFAVKLLLDDHDKDIFLAAGAHGAGAIYTHHLEAVQILRKVLIRIGANLNWFIWKLH